MNDSRLINVNIEQSWKDVLAEEFQKPYFISLRDFLMQERAEGHIIYPAGTEIFNAFKHTPFDRVKVLLLGQDPYHGPGQAHGLSFSVPEGVPMPPSLKNIFKELSYDLNIDPPQSGNLEKWAAQGVMLLNAILTVRAHSPASHHNQGWETFTDAVIKTLSEKRSGIVFLLWGKYAQQKVSLIDSTKHHVLTAPHPSPFSAGSGFFQCKHFSKTNELLERQGLPPIDWRI